MKSLLGDEYEQFKQSYQQAPHAGIRINTLKISKEQFSRISPFSLAPIPWCETGYYVEKSARPGRHPYYHAGLYYIQEPSAMAPAELLGVVPGDRVLDLCAAPGGKSTQIAAKLAGSGLLISNDLSPDRTKALAKNVEMCGVRNAVVLNETPDRIAEVFPQFFTKILIDAPCSGEGMFRKDADMLKHWDPSSPHKYADMQREILSSAAKMLCKGGRLVYSTCTFSPEENEGIIAAFLKDHSEFSVVPIGDSEWFSPGEAQWVMEHSRQQDGAGDPDFETYIEQTRGTGRLWPHRVNGEGHFIAVLKRAGELDEQADLHDWPKAEAKGAWQSSRPEKKQKPSRKSGDRLKQKKVTAFRRSGERSESDRKGSEQSHLEIFYDFVHKQLNLDLSKGYPVVHGNYIYLSPLPKGRLEGLKTVRAGWYMGQIKFGRFIPSHPLATALKPGEALRSVSLSSQDGEAVRYLKGETLEIPSDRIHYESVTDSKGYVLVCIDGYSAGWGKWQSGILKNEYPASWRWIST